MDNINIKWIEELKGLNKLNLDDFLNKFKVIDSYSNKEQYLKEFSNEQINTILSNEEFIKIFYLTPQAEYIKKTLDLDNLKILETLVYCYNTNEREFKKLEQERILKAVAEKEGFIEGNIFNTEDLKKLDKLKVFCIMDISKIGLMGSFDKTEKLEGTFSYVNHLNGLMLIPKRSRTRGYLIRNRFYYKVK